MSINEKLFKISADHLIRQSCKALSYWGDSSNDWGDSSNELKPATCVFRNEHGLKCAVGALIGDVHYSKNLEGWDVENFLVRNAIESTHNIVLDETIVSMLWSLQEIHDHSAPIEWSRKLTDLADELGFDWTPPEVPV
jgi:hypothetical protein